MPTIPPEAGVTRAEMITVHPNSRWADLMVSFSESERRCVQDSIGDDFAKFADVQNKNSPRYPDPCVHLRSPGELHDCQGNS